LIKQAKLSVTCCNAVFEMKYKQHHTLGTVLLAALVIVGLSLSSVQSSTMDIMMSMSSSMDTINSEACDDCPEGDDGIAAGCSSICMIAAFATLPLSINLERILQSERIEVFPVAPRDGPRSTEPNPPKHHDFS
jgi:hypothetical protein